MGPEINTEILYKAQVMRARVAEIPAHLGWSDQSERIATRKVSDGTVIVGLPGSTQSVTATAPETIRPTLKVPHGSSVSVFVARDLDFIAVE